MIKKINNFNYKYDSYFYIFIIIIFILILIIAIAIIMGCYKKYKNKEHFLNLNEESILLETPKENIKTIYVRENIKINDIPLNLFTCWHTSELPPKMNNTINKIKNDNLDFNIYIFNNNDCRNMIKKYFIADVLNAYDSLNSDAYKSDLWRYCALYLYGGIYQDIKFEPINNFKYSYFTDKEYFAKDIDESNKGVLNGLLVCKKNNTILEKAIKKIIINVKNKYYGTSSLEPTGPLLLKNFFSEYEIDTLKLKLTGKGNDIKIMFNDKEILKMYDGYRNEQKEYGTKHYDDVWKEKKMYIN